MKLTISLSSSCLLCSGRSRWTKCVALGMITTLAIGACTKSCFSPVSVCHGQQDETRNQALTQAQELGHRQRKRPTTAARLLGRSYPQPHRSAIESTVAGE